MKINIRPDGPYLVTGKVPLSVEVIAADADGNSLGYERRREFDAQEKYALCRCGRSENKPFCDGTHASVGFDGTETAPRASFAELAERLDGPALTLLDAQPYCAYGRFCDVAGTVWNLVQEKGKEARELTIREAALCPSGRLVVRDDRGVYEPELPPSIVLLEDPAKNCSGPLWVRGGIEVTAGDGTAYEVRNRVTLCRCGASKNKPFCDGSHDEAGFKDGLETA